MVLRKAAIIWGVEPVLTWERSDKVAADWKLPPAIITGLPGGLIVSLNYDEPESIGRVIRALASPPENMETDT